MRITAAIMAHPKRREQAMALYSELSKYPFDDLEVAWDHKNEEWDTGERALRFGIDKGDWHVVIQDDALLTPYFYSNVESAINGLPTKSTFSLYTGTSRPIGQRVKAAVGKAPDGTWLAFHQLLWGVGIVLPSDHIKPMLDFVKDISLQYDNRIGEFYTRNGLKVYYTIPSLVNHDDALDSLIDGHGRAIDKEPRVAHRLAKSPVTWTNDHIYI